MRAAIGKKMAARSIAAAVSRDVSWKTCEANQRGEAGLTFRRWCWPACRETIMYGERPIMAWHEPMTVNARLHAAGGLAWYVSRRMIASWRGGGLEEYSRRWNLCACAKCVTAVREAGRPKMHVA